MITPTAADSSPATSVTPWFRRNYKFAISVALGLTVAFFILCEWVSKPPFPATRLETPYGKESTAIAINNAGMVVGTSTTDNRNSHIFIWTKEDGVKDLGSFAGIPTSATAINDEGVVIGWFSGIFSIKSRVFVWTKNGGFKYLGSLIDENYSDDLDDAAKIRVLSANPHDYSGAKGINAAGEIVGNISIGKRQPDIYSSPFIWTKKGGMKELESLGGRHGAAYAINDAGMIVGYSMAKDNQSRAMLWTKDGVMKNLGTLGGTVSFAQAINNSGMVVGESTTTNDSALHAFLWTHDGGMEDIGSLGKNVVGTNFVINDAGMIAGSSEMETPTNFAFVWTRENGMQSLNNNDYCVVNGINEAGMVVGYYSKIRDGNRRAFVWTKEKGRQDLGTLGYDFGYASAVNNAGQIVGCVGNNPPWWIKTWDWIGEKHNLPKKYRIHSWDYFRTEAVLWTVPSPKNDSENSKAKN